MPPQPRPVLERFMEKVSPEPNSGCWLWTGGIRPADGYGAIWSQDRKRMLLAHRVAYELFVGAPPAGLDLDHKCRVRCCVNPDHLRAVSRRENVLAGFGSPVQENHRKQYCSRGHEFTSENTKLIPWRASVHRRCRICIKIMNDKRASPS